MVQEFQWVGAVAGANENFVTTSHPTRIRLGKHCAAIPSKGRNLNFRSSRVCLEISHFVRNDGEFFHAFLLSLLVNR
jgi:hypothetical protein